VIEPSGAVFTAQLVYRLSCCAIVADTILPRVFEAHWALVSLISRSQCQDAKRPPLRGVEGVGACGESRG
jgi:hypothetical protein